MCNEDICHLVHDSHGIEEPHKIFIEEKNIKRDVFTLERQICIFFFKGRCHLVELLDHTGSTTVRAVGLGGLWSSLSLNPPQITMD